MRAETTFDNAELAEKMRSRKANAEDSALVEVNGTPTAIALNEDNVALVFAQQYSGKLLYDHTSRQWLVWDGARWKPEQTRLAYEYTRRLVRTLNTEGKARWSKASVFAAVETIACADRAFARTRDQFDVDPWLLGTPAGIVHLKTGALTDADPAAMITRITGVDPEVGDPVRWLKFLEEVTGGDIEVIRFLKRLCGYCLTGLATEQLLVFIIGPGGTGKGVFINVLLRVLGDYAQVADMRTFTASRHERHPTELAAMHGARVVTASETEQTSQWAEARVKQLTGGDPVRARFVKCDEFEYRPQFQLLIVGNHRPRLRDVGRAMRRRLRLVPFEHVPHFVNPNLEQQLVTEEGGRILNWMIEGCLDWQEDGLPVPAAVQAETDDYFNSQDTFNDWLTAACDTDPKFNERSSDLFKSWSGYCQQAGDDPGSAVTFADEMKQRGFQKKTTATGKVWLGVRMKRPGP